MIYLIKAKDWNFYKIGYASKSIKKRVKSIQTSCPFKLKVIKKINGGFYQETILHTLFKSKQQQGEWFKLDNQYLNILLNTMDYLDTPIELPVKYKKPKKNKLKDNQKKRIWYKWRVRAKNMNIPLLNNCRPTQEQRLNWEQSIIKAESTHND